MEGKALLRHSCALQKVSRRDIRIVRDQIGQEFDPPSGVEQWKISSSEE